MVHHNQDITRVAAKLQRDTGIRIPGKKEGANAPFFLSFYMEDLYAEVEQVTEELALQYNYELMMWEWKEQD